MPFAFRPRYDIFVFAAMLLIALMLMLMMRHADADADADAALHADTYSHAMPLRCVDTRR